MATNDTDRPFPLLRSFLIYVLPLLIIGVVGFMYSLRETTAGAIEAFYADVEKANVRMALRDAFGDDPRRWRNNEADEFGKASASLSAELKELGVSCLTLSGPDGDPRLLIGGDGCRYPPAASFAEIGGDVGSILKEELVLPQHWTTLTALGGPDRSSVVLAAISRPSKGLEAVIGLASSRQTLLFAGLLGTAGIVGLGLVWRAQKDLDLAFSRQKAVRDRMRRFLSKGARLVAASGVSVANRRDAVVMFADLRNFSGFADTADVEETAALVNAFLKAVDEAVEANDGDVDRHLGDGVLAWFEGSDAADRALAAAVRCVDRCGALPRRLGVGLYGGEVLAVSLGGGDRLDFTILGRTVNLASRLCELAGDDEIVAPAGLFDEPPARTTLLDERQVYVKHHTKAVRALRYKVIPPNATPT